jgi:hypothetical protein
MDIITTARGEVGCEGVAPGTELWLSDARCGYFSVGNGPRSPELRFDCRKGYPRSAGRSVCTHTRFRGSSMGDFNRRTPLERAIEHEKLTSDSRGNWLTEPLCWADRTLSHPLEPGKLGELLLNLALARGGEASVQQTSIPEPIDGTADALTHWSAGGITAAVKSRSLVLEDGSKRTIESLELQFPESVKMNFRYDLRSYVVSGPQSEALAVEQLFRDVLYSLGWSDLPGLPWRDGRVFLSD